MARRVYSVKPLVTVTTRKTLSQSFTFFFWQFRVPRKFFTLRYLPPVLSEQRVCEKVQLWPRGSRHRSASLNACCVTKEILSAEAALCRLLCPDDLVYYFLLLSSLAQCLCETGFKILVCIFYSFNSANRTYDHNDSFSEVYTKRTHLTWVHNRRDVSINSRKNSFNNQCYRTVAVSCFKLISSWIWSMRNTIHPNISRTMFQF